MADFNWNWPKKIDRDVIQRALTVDFIKEGRNLVLIGTNGLGKTMIAKNIANAAILAGHSVLFRSAAELLDDLQCDSPLLQRRKLKRYARPSLLCIDELGYLAYDNHAADLLYEVINRRYERRSVVVTTIAASPSGATFFPMLRALPRYSTGSHTTPTSLSWKVKATVFMKASRKSRLAEKRSECFC